MKSAGSFFSWIQRRTHSEKAVPEHIRTEVRTVQLERALRHMPMIYAVATFNILLIIALCIHKNMPVLSYAWIGAIAIFSIIRMLQWMRRAKSRKTLKNPERMLRSLTYISVGLISGLSAWSIYALTTETFADMALIPISLVFGSTCIAHCLAPIKRAAVGVLLVGVLPVAMFLIIGSNFENFMLGISMLSIALLMMIFIVESYEQIIDGIVMEYKVRRLANSDALTGLANRRAIMGRLADIDAREGKAKIPYALALLDLDGFKQVNDTHGHHIGDALLKLVAKRLSKTAVQTEYVGRLGGDEFFVLMDGFHDDKAPSARVSAYLAALCQPVEIEGHRLSVFGSMGYAIYLQDGDTTKALMHAADKALYAAKEESREGFNPRNGRLTRSAG